MDLWHDPEARARYRAAVTTWRVERQPKLLRDAWQQYVAELVQRGSISAEEARLPRWRSPNVGKLAGQRD